LKDSSSCEYAQLICRSSAADFHLLIERKANEN
jgi:hypothetical protein